MGLSRVPRQARRPALPDGARLAAAAAAGAAALCGLTGCASASATCTVRHGYAIVIFQNGAGNEIKKIVTRFRLNVTYPGYVRHRLIVTRIALDTPAGGNAPLIIKTYRVGSARSCRVELVRARR